MTPKKLRQKKANYKALAPCGNCDLMVRIGEGEATSPDEVQQVIAWTRGGSV